MHLCYAMTQLMSLPYNYYRCVPAQPSVRTTWLMLRPRTTVGAYRLTYVVRWPLYISTVSSPELLETCVTLHATDALHTVYVAAYFTTVHVIIHLMLLPYKLMSYRDTTYFVRSRTVTQLMLLGHDRTIYVVRNITYDAMSLIATYVRYLCCSTT
jgi:hypothetical protein